MTVSIQKYDDTEITREKKTISRYLILIRFLLYPCLCFGGVKKGCQMYSKSSITSRTCTSGEIRERGKDKRKANCINDSLSTIFFTNNCDIVSFVSKANCLKETPL